MKYYSDKPINTITEDLLDRSSFSKLLANTLVNLNGSDTFTVGLFGKWGSGKTSIVNMALQEIENRQVQSDKELVVVRFEPWHFSDSTQLLSQFFIRLSNEFKSKKDERLNNIGKEIEKYSNIFDLAKLIPMYGEIIANVAKFGVKKIGKMLQVNTSNLDIMSQKQAVINLLEKQNCKILVVIDDIDRLSSEQIRQVFQLVSSVAKFPNTAYLLVFDKEVVVKSLEKVQEGDGQDYLEKIIQMPIQIPDIPREKLHKVLFNRLDQVLSAYPDTSYFKEHWQRVFTPCVSPFISNLRDINRLSNALRFKLTTISSEIDFAYMVSISAIEIAIPEIYEWIKEQKDLLTSGYSFYDFGAKKKTQAECLKEYSTIIEERLISKQGDNTTRFDTNTVITALAYLFPYFGQKIGKTYEAIDEKLFRRKNLIAHPEKIDRYFYYDFDQITLKKSSVEKAVFSLSCDDFISFMIREDENDRGILVLKEINALIEEITPERAKVLFEALILLRHKLKTIERQSIVSIGASSYAENFCIDLLDRVIASERKDLLASIIQNANFETLNTLAVFINMLELGYGRLAANGTEYDYKKVITLEELLQIENIFIEKIKLILKSECLFDQSDWRITLHLMKSFDSEYANNYLLNSLQENKNIIVYLWESVSTWTGSGNSYEVKDQYSDYLTKDRILNAIKDEVNSKKIFNLKREIIERAAAFYLDDAGLLDWDGHISQEKVDKTIEDWKTQGIV